MIWFKKIFGKKEKSYIPKDFTLEERKISPLLPIKDEEQPISVPIEEKITDFGIAVPIEIKKDRTFSFKDGKLKEENKKKKSSRRKKKTKKKAEKKDKFNDDASKPKGRNFLI